jgi:hypothetical protein
VRLASQARVQAGAHVRRPKADEAIFLIDMSVGERRVASHRSSEAFPQELIRRCESTALSNHHVLARE